MGGESDREKETFPGPKREAGDSRSLWNREGGAALEGDGCGTAKEWLWDAEAVDDREWGTPPFEEEELCECRCASSMAVRTSGWLAWYFSRCRARER